MKMCKIYLALALAICFGGSGFAVEVKSGEKRRATALTMHYVAAPMGLHALMYGSRRVAFIDASGRDVDIVWREPRGRFAVSKKGSLTEVQPKKGEKVPIKAFRFEANGLLSSLELNEGASPAKVRKTFFPKLHDPLQTYWRSVKKQTGETVDYWAESDRLRLRYSNPNASGALFAELSVLMLAGLLFLRPIWARIVFGVLTVGSLACLFLTGSRGSFLGFCFGALVVVALWGWRRFSFKRVAFAVAVIVTFAGLMLGGVFGDRFGKDLLEQSYSNLLRLHCWKAAPAMMAAAPDGWGKECGRAYCDWFQAKDDYHPQYWMINGHLTWMVERGWGGRFAYCSLWLLVLAGLGLAAKRSRMASAALATWLTWAVAMWFSTLGESWTLWIVPGVSLLLVVGWEACSHPTPRGLLKVGAALALALLAGGGTCLLLSMLGNRALGEMEVPVSHKDGVVTAGKGSDKAWIVVDEQATSLGLIGTFGREVRDFLVRHPEFGSIVVTTSVRKVPVGVDTLVLTGRKADQFLMHKAQEKSVAGVKKLVFLSPSCRPKPDLPTIIGCQDMQLVTGEVMKSLYVRADEKAPQWMTFVPGAGVYVPGWLDLVLTGGK